MKRTNIYKCGLGFSMLCMALIIIGAGKHMAKNCCESTITTKSGLQYTVEQSGDACAQVAKKGMVVSVHYTGYLMDSNGNLGKVFDSSIPRGEPIQFVLGTRQVIAGWDEGIEGMRVGEKRRLIIPANLAYGASGIRGVIPGNATLIFDTELVAVK